MRRAETVDYIHKSTFLFYTRYGLGLGRGEIYNLFTLFFNFYKLICTELEQVNKK
jgi:hypothetical protein